MIETMSQTGRDFWEEADIRGLLKDLAVCVCSRIFHPVIEQELMVRLQPEMDETTTATGPATGVEDLQFNFGALNQSISFNITPKLRC